MRFGTKAAGCDCLACVLTKQGRELNAKLDRMVAAEAAAQAAERERGRDGTD